MAIDFPPPSHCVLFVFWHRVSDIIWACVEAAIDSSSIDIINALTVAVKLICHLLDLRNNEFISLAEHPLLRVTVLN